MESARRTSHESSTINAGKRIRAWHTCLEPLKPATEAKQEQLDNGRYVHAIIEGMHPEANKESEKYFDDAGLEFTICYHPDLYDPLTSCLWEIKTENFLVRHWDYCLAQLSGYRHFTGARVAGFLVYKLKPSKEKPTLDDICGPFPCMPSLYWSWQDLREIARSSDVELQTRELKLNQG
jgi:hypothetical protein